MSNKITALIVDDEQASRITLRNYLDKYCPSVEVLGEAENIVEAQQKIQKLQPELLFLDVEMPFGNAFDLLEKFKELPFEVIFVTAFSHYALEALHLSASNYLLKPLEINQLVEAVDKVIEDRKLKGQMKTSSILLENLLIEQRQLKKVVLPMMEGFEVVVLQEVVYVEADDNLSTFYLSDGTKRTVCKTLKYYEDVLRDYDFIRIHKSHVININYLKQYLKGKGGEVVLSTGVHLAVSPSRKQDLLDQFK